jgi:hypothetical protein
MTCEEAKEICNKAQYNEASFLEKLKLLSHTFMCKICARFTKENTKLTALCQKADLKSFSEAEKTELKKHLQKHL